MWATDKLYNLESTNESSTSVVNSVGKSDIIPPRKYLEYSNDFPVSTNTINSSNIFDFFMSAEQNQTENIDKYQQTITEEDEDYMFFNRSSFPLVYDSY